MKHKGKILIIEDEPIWQEKLKKYLTEAGFYVEIVTTLQEGLDKLQNELFHFVTIDLRLDQDTIDPLQYEGWTILKKIIELKAVEEQNLGTMVITGWPKEYLDLKGVKNAESMFFMSKAEFDKKTFIDVVTRIVEQGKMRFKDDHMSN